MFCLHLLLHSISLTGCTIDWFLPWPQDALVAVSQGLMGSFNIECSDEVKAELMLHMGFAHAAADSQSPNRVPCNVAARRVGWAGPHM